MVVSVGFPSNATWPSQLAGILPLSALIEFIDIPMKLHKFALTGYLPLWSWPITPAGARLILGNRGFIEPCCLDDPARSESLHCIDGRYGDLYPCSLPTTVRLCAATMEEDLKVINDSPNLQNPGNRVQTLDTVIVVPAVETATSGCRILAPCATGLTKLYSVKYLLASGTGWLLWTALTLASLYCSLYVAGAFLVLMPLTGGIVQLTYGGGGKRLLDTKENPWDRLVIATDSLNGIHWYAFHGKSVVLNCFLNKPLALNNTEPPSFVGSRTFQLLMHLSIAAQWATAVASCSVQDWNAFVITFWIAFCALFETYIYTAQDSVRDWMKYTCNFSLLRVDTSFSSRRALLSALVYLNPDKVGHTQWIDAILARSEDRQEWETALFTFLKTGACEDPETRCKYWWKFIEEGVEVGRKIEARIQEYMKVHV